MKLDRDYFVRISEDALIQLVLNGLEAYSVHHLGNEKAKTLLETYGLLWGHEIRLPETNNIHYSIELISIDTSAKRGRNSCNYNDSALELKRHILTSNWPHYDFLGDVHTHPYKDYKIVEANKYYNFSKDDIEDLEENSKKWKNHNYRVGLVLTIAQMQKAGRKETKYLKPNLIEFTLGDYRLWIKCYVILNEDTIKNEGDGKKSVFKVSEHDEEKVHLDCCGAFSSG